MLSRSVRDLPGKPQFDAIVIGSGYGGGVAAVRLARAGQRVCVLERGREIPIGEFPDRLSMATKELQVRSAKHRIGKRTGLFDLRLNDDVHIFVGCGLGGTSLINANVCLRPDPRIFDDLAWPDEIRNDGLLQHGFARARHMLRPDTYTGDEPLAKVAALEAAATALGHSLDSPPLHVSFEDGPNAANVMQSACTLCGDCCAGCNVGAKTTVPLTYLAEAAAFGAQIYCYAEVHTVSKNGDGGWHVEIHPTDDDANNSSITLSAKQVIIAAGTLGSNEILLRSRAAGLALSDQLGQRFTSNGDVLATGYNNDIPVNGVGVGNPPCADVSPVGPAVAGLIDLRGTDNVNDGLAVVEASIPSAMAPILSALLVPGAKLFGEDADTTFRDELDEARRAAESLLHGAYRGAVHNTQTFLVIGHDTCGGCLVLDDDRLAIKWPNAVDQEVFGRIETLLKAAVSATGGTYLPNPASGTMLGSSLVTVHPLGGCAMGNDRTSGVVNHKGAVFDAAPNEAAEAVHDGLFVIDGSVMPRSIGIHPLLTITAVAERAMHHMIADNGWQVNEKQRSGPANRIY